MTELISLSRRIVQAHGDHTLLDAPSAELVPADADAAYAIQHEILALRSTQIAGWKVGAKALSGPIQGAPLPEDGLHASGVRLPRQSYAPLGLELEIVFRFGRSFNPSRKPYADDEVLAGITTMAAAVEIVASRFAAWPEVDKLAQLADLQNHGALVVGEAVPYRDAFPFVTPSLHFNYNHDPIVKDGWPSNPAGDPRRLLTWLVNHCTLGRGIALTPDMIVTTGSYTGMFFPAVAGVASGEIAGLPPVTLTLF